MKKKGLSIALAALMSVAAVSALTNSVYAGSAYTAGLTTATDGTNPISQNTTTIDKYLVMDVNANVPNATFDFSITSYDTTKAEKTVLVTATDNTTLSVINGVTTQSTGTLDFKDAGVVTFAPTDSTITEEVNRADTDTNKDDPVYITNDTGKTNDEKYAKKTLTLDFSTVQFTEPGVYRYLITETGDNQGITNDIGVTGTANNTYRTLDVYVEDYADYYSKLSDTTGYTEPVGKQLYIANYVLYAGKYDAAPSATAATASGKSKSYTNAYASHDITFGKVVTGNQGSRDKYFKFTVEISNLKAVNNKMAVVTTNADTSVPVSAALNAATLAAYAGKVNPTLLEVNTSNTDIGDDGYKVETITGTPNTYKITAEYYLQHGQYITIQGVPDSAFYNITEDDEDYSATQGITADLSTLDWDSTHTGNDALSDAVSNTTSTTGITADVHTGYTNTRTGVIPTGVILSVAAPAGIGVAVVGGIIYLIAKRRKDENEDDE